MPMIKRLLNAVFINWFEAVKVKESNLRRVAALYRSELEVDEKPSKILAVILYPVIEGFDVGLL